MKFLHGKGSWLLVACVLAVTVAALGHRPSDGERAADDGERVVTENRSVNGSVTAVVLDGPVNLTLRQGSDARLTVRAEARVLPNIGTTVEGASLRIAPQGMLLNPRQPIDVALTLPALASLHAGGSGATTVTGFGGRRIDLVLDGSGSLHADVHYAAAAIALHGSGALTYAAGAADSIALDAVGTGAATLAGAVRDLHATLTGAGELDAGALRAGDVTIVQQGSGDSRVDARGSASVELRGSGDVLVTGRPAQRTVHKKGSGTVVFAE